MYDIVAVESESAKVLWTMPWRKGMPMWNKVSIVRSPPGSDGGPIVELEAKSVRTGKVQTQLLRLHDGKEIVDIDPKTPDPNVAIVQQAVTNRNPQTWRSRRTALAGPRLFVVETEGERVTRAYMRSSQTGRSSEELLQHFRRIRHAIQT